MTLPPPLQARLADGLGAPLEDAQSATGGSINQGAWARFGGRDYFVKWRPGAPPGFFDAEADGLARLREADAIRIPAPLAWDDADPDDGCPAFLLMEFIPGPSRTAGFDRRAFGQRLGEQLAELHRFGTQRDQYGLERDNVIGALPQTNTPASSWVAFWRDTRLRPQIERAERAGRLRTRHLDRLNTLLDRLPELLPDTPPVALLHGDLWSGNYVIASDGAPALIDPAVYYGDREVDLAMAELFGGFPSSVWDAYHATWPLDPGHDDRRRLYQVYPLLVHVNLFGGGYVRQLGDAIAPYTG